MYDSRNLIERDEPEINGDMEIVECPVCEDSGHWLTSNEVCTIIRGHRKYKKCDHGTYINEVCGNRRDCFRGPGEQCTEKMEFDTYGQKCAPGYYCNKPMGICQGMDYVLDSNELFLLNPHRRYSLQRNTLKGPMSHSLLDAIRN
uniref:Uncharacterized protein n=1 Tax=Bombyx mori TaxID=7091 RepID=A0A8R2C5R4_BOMMO|nr:uncharacterized protein LOC105841533 [Bombyx mori]